MVKTALVVLAASVTTADAGECYCSCCNWCHMTECYDGHSCCDDTTCSGCDVEPHPTQDMRVEIAYTPSKLLGASSQEALCTVDGASSPITQYFLLMKHDTRELALVGANKDRRVCENDDGFTDDDHTGWKRATDGYFSAPKDEPTKNSCLMLDTFAGHNLNTNTLMGTSCTSNNQINGNGWYYDQDDYKHVCMQPVPDADSANSVVVRTMQADSLGKDCSHSWSEAPFDGKLLQSDLPQPAIFHNATTLHSDDDGCPACLSDIGNFACHTLDGCHLAPSKDICELGLKGKWCGPDGWNLHGSCGPQCAGAVDPLLQPAQAGCVQLGGVFKTSATDCARIADNLVEKADCRGLLMTANKYEEQDAVDCEALVEASKKSVANVFDTVHGYAPDSPAHPQHCRLWQCDKLGSEKNPNIPTQDGDQAWLIAYKIKPLALSMIV